MLFEGSPRYLHTQLGAPTVDATECRCSGHVSRSIRTQTTHTSEAAAAWPWVVCMRPWAWKGQAVESTSVGRAPSVSQSVLRRSVLKMLHLRRFCSTLACNMPLANAVWREKTAASSAAHQHTTARALSARL